jgi:hypothetical protein
MRVAIGERSEAANLSPIIDENRFVPFLMPEWLAAL